MDLTNQSLLAAFSPITLEEMASIRLMNRIDTKYLLTVDELRRFLALASADYLVQQIGGERLAEYHTVYLDTPMLDMYYAHAHGRAVREKIRVRTYVASQLSFLEVKHKNNKGRTDKRRIRVGSLGSLRADGGADFLRLHALYALEQLTPQLENRFTRITLVNRRRTERLTIDCNICFTNLTNGQTARLDNLAVVELKRDGRVPSPVRDILRELRVVPSSFSKYCMGSALTNHSLRQNRFKPRLRRAVKLNQTVS